MCQPPALEQVFSDYQVAGVPSYCRVKFDIPLTLMRDDGTTSLLLIPDVFL